MAGEIVTQKINLEDVGRYFEGKGYKVKKLAQLWRHVTGELLFDNEKLFLKLASTKEIAEKTRNEKFWNENVNSIWKKYIHSFKSPKVFDEGEFEGLYWFVCEYTFGKPLAEVSKQKKDINEKDLERAAEMARDITTLGEAVLLPNDRAKSGPCLIDGYLANAKLWSKNTKVNTRKLLQFIEDVSEDIKIGACHGDFTPWAIMKTKINQYYLIDGESSRLLGLKHYDAAYFYHRVYTKYLRPDLAEKFLNKYKEIMNFDEAEEKVFYPVIASRILGGYFDAERDNVTSNDLNRELEAKLYK